jgi:putative transcriptional regulator
MTPIDNSYAAFMLDYASGALSPGESLAASIHCALSARGARATRMLNAIGGSLLEEMAGSQSAETTPDVAAFPLRERPVRDLSFYTERDFLALNWRTGVFGVKTLPTPDRGVKLMRLDPGGRAPSHGHGRRDVTVVLVGTYADEYGVYERGDIAFAEPGLRHQPRAVGDQPCVCLIAEEPSRGLSGWFRNLLR